jgi:uncharacterized protein (DUF1778 family)
MSDQLRIPLTANQKRLIAEAADLESLDMTAWARSVLLCAAREHGSRPDRTTRKA